MTQLGVVNLSPPPVHPAFKGDTWNIGGLTATLTQLGLGFQIHQHGSVLLLWQLVLLTGNANPGSMPD